MSVNLDVGASGPAGHFGAAEAEPTAVSRDWVRDLTLGRAMTLGVVASCALSVVLFLS